MHLGLLVRLKTHTCGPVRVAHITKILFASLEHIIYSNRNLPSPYEYKAKHCSGA
jgi:hypothetical protein